MSHWTKIKTKLTDREMLKKALDRMGIAHQEGAFTINQYGKSEKAEIKLDEAVGLSLQEDGTWSMVGDFYHSHKAELRKFYSRGNDFSAQLGTAYSVEQAKEELTMKGFFCTGNEDAEVGEVGMIRMTFESF